MQKVRFTDRTIDSLKPGNYSDTLLPAFCIRVGSTRKTFYAIRSGTRTTIGKYGEISLQDARSRARVILADPTAQRSTTKLSEAVEAYLRTRDYRPGPLKETERLLKKHLASFLNADIDTITTLQLSNLFDRMRSTPSEANHLYGVTRTFFRWAAQRGYCANPLTFPKPYKEKSRSRILTDAELVRVWDSSTLVGTFGTIIRLCILTAQRRGEIGQLKPDWLDKFAMTIPAAVAKNGKAHTIPLPGEAASLALSLADDLKTPWNTWSKPKAALDKLSGVTDWTIHDLRRTAASKMAELGIAPHVIERILNHSAPASLGGSLGITYNRHRYETEMRDALLQYQAWLHNLLEKTDDGPHQSADRQQAEHEGSPRPAAQIPEGHGRP